MDYIHSTFYYFLSRDTMHSLVCSIAIYSFPLFCTQLFFCCCTIVLWCIFWCIVSLLEVLLYSRVALHSFCSSSITSSVILVAVLVFLLRMRQPRCLFLLLFLNSSLWWYTLHLTFSYVTAVQCFCSSSHSSDAHLLLFPLFMVLWAITLFLRCVDKPIVEAQLDLIQRLRVDRLPSLDLYHLLGANWESQACAL